MHYKETVYRTVASVLKYDVIEIIVEKYSNTITDGEILETFKTLRKVDCAFKDDTKQKAAIDLKKVDENGWNSDGDVIKTLKHKTKRGKVLCAYKWSTVQLYKCKENL